MRTLGRLLWWVFALWSEASSGAADLVCVWCAAELGPDGACERCTDIDARGLAFFDE